MEVSKGLDGLRCWEGAVACLGNFDGVHRGHQELIKETVRRARLAGVAAVVLTFDPHPMKLLAPESTPRMIITNFRKARLLEELGVDAMLLVPFDEGLASMEPEEFIGDLLYRHLHPRQLLVGFNYTFGRGARGNAKLLQQFGAKLGFAVEVIAPVTVNEQTVSSTAIREALLQGKVDHAARLLGYPPLLEGIVERGDQRGREIGFPTANLAMDGDILAPADGVYAAEVIYAYQTWQGVVNIGPRPTFGVMQTAVEVFMMGFEGNLYGEQLVVHLWQRLRGVIKFPSKQALVEQIQQDIAAARELTINRAE